jgi:hypothetical protein
VVLVVVVVVVVVVVAGVACEPPWLLPAVTCSGYLHAVLQ